MVFCGNFLCSKKGAFVDSNIFSLCTSVTETVLLYNEVLCYFLKSDITLVYVVRTQISLICETYLAEHVLALPLLSITLCKY
jgi:hypothetical protein